MGQGLTRKALDDAAAARIGRAFDHLVDQMATASSEQDRLQVYAQATMQFRANVALTMVAHQNALQLTDKMLAQMPAPPPPAPPTESDDDYRRRLLATVGPASVNHKAVLESAGEALDRLGEMYDLPRRRANGGESDGERRQGSA